MKGITMLTTKLLTCFSVSIYSDRTTFGGHVKVHSSVLVVINNKYIENQAKAHVGRATFRPIESAFFWRVCQKKADPIGQEPISRDPISQDPIGQDPIGGDTPEEGQPNQLNIVRPTSAFSYYSRYTYLWLPKLNGEPSRGHQKRSVWLLYIEINLIAFKQSSTIDCITIWSVVGSPSYYFAFLLSTLA